VSKRRSPQQTEFDLKLVPREQNSRSVSLDEGSGREFDPRVAAMTIAEGLLDIDDPLEAEIVGSLFLAIIEVFGKESEDAMIEYFLPTFEANADPSAAAMLAVLDAVGGPRIALAARTGVQRLRARGVTTPAWVTELSEPVTAHDCLALSDPDGDTLLLAARFERASSSHGIVVLVDPEDCSEAAEILLLPADELSEALGSVHRNARHDGITLTESTLDPAEFRWHAEIAMDVRDDHDRDDATAPEDLAGELGDDDGPGYRTLAALLRARLRALPISDKPKPLHGGDLNPAAVLAAFEQMTSSRQLGTGFGRGTGKRAPTPAKLPPKRKTRDGTTPILRLRVDLGGAKPPIWRRLEVRGDIPLAALHNVLQVAFDWDDSHLYAFDTDYGTFGQPDPQLGHRSDKNVTLEQVAAAPGARLTYTYDFGDDWDHRIAVEKSLPPDPSTGYPRCTGGRRAAPPEDCGGIWGYQELLDILADPRHDEHEERLEWLGLNRATDFDPAFFDPSSITESLSRFRRTPGKQR